LVRAAEAARRHAHAPYSRYLVGAAVETDDGAVYAGCNVENASFGLTICAERAAVCAAVAAGARRIRRAVVITDSDPPGAPCGACRQVLAEFGLDMEVTAIGSVRRIDWRLRDLLPDAFTGEVLR
jgi:cytidine deaminase